MTGASCRTYQTPPVKETSWTGGGKYTDDEDLTTLLREHQLGVRYVSDFPVKVKAEKKVNR